MDNQQRILRIVQSVSKNKNVPASDESLFDSGYLDSFAINDMVSELEKEFGIRVPDSDARPRKFETLERIQQYIESKQ